jgi:hypothetical protein
MSRHQSRQPYATKVIKDALIRAFWHRSRKEVVPFTAEELVGRTGIDLNEIQRIGESLVRKGLMSSLKDGVFELSDAGKEACSEMMADASGWKFKSIRSAQ